MRVTADSNVLLRALTGDDIVQSELARELLANAETVVLARHALCEVVWVLSRGYRIPSAQIAIGLRDLLASANVVFDSPAAEAGLALLDAGGDFADGVIAHEGAALGADSFVSFDRKAVGLLTEQGRKARLLA